MKKNLFRFLCLTLLAGMTFAACDSNDGKYTITVKSADVSQGKAYGGGDFDAGTTTRIWGTPEVGYQFDRWNDGNTENPRTITVNGDATYTAYFKTVGGDTPGGGGDNPGGGGDTPGDFSASFTIDGTSYQGIALVSLGMYQGLLNLSIYAGEQGPVFVSYILPTTGTQTLNDGINIFFYGSESDFVHTDQGDMPPYLSVAGMNNVTFTVSELDLTAQTLNVTGSGTLLDIAAAEAGNPTSVPFTVSMSGAWQTAQTPQQ